MDLRLIKKLITLLEDSSLSELSVEQNGFVVSLKKPSHHLPVATHPIYPPYQKTAEEKTIQQDETSRNQAVTSPMVGTFYHASAPDQPAYVKVGQRVQEGETIGIIEAMKMMNLIPSPFSGIVESIVVPNGDAVEFGQTLITIKQG